MRLCIDFPVAKNDNFISLKDMDVRPVNFNEQRFSHEIQSQITRQLMKQIDCHHSYTLLGVSFNNNTQLKTCVLDGWIL